MQRTAELQPLRIVDQLLFEVPNLDGAQTRYASDPLGLDHLDTLGLDPLPVCRPAYPCTVWVFRATGDGRTVVRLCF